MDFHIQMVKKCFFVITFLLLPVSPLISEPLVLISAKIKPYFEVIEGMEKVLGNHIHVEAIEDEPQDIFLYTPWIALGKKAVDYFIRYGKDEEIFFALVEDPESIKTTRSKICGIRIEQSPERIIRGLKLIREKMKIKKFSLFFTPNSPAYIKNVVKTAEKSGVNIEGIELTDLSQLPLRMGMVENYSALLILPDPSLINPATVTFILKESVKRHIVAIGYNRWFVQEGALFAIHIPYRETGVMLGKIIKGGCYGKIFYPPSEIAVNYTLGNRWKINPDVLKSLDGLRLK